MVGQLHLESDWSESEVIAEIRSTFSDNVTEDVQFQFLQFTGTGTKSLMVPKVSSSYKWTPKEVAGRADRPIYLLLLPLALETYDKFKENMTLAILNTVGFGQP